MARSPRPSPRGRARRRVMVIVVGAALLGLLVFTVFVSRLAERAVQREAEARVASTAELSARLVAEQSLRFQEVVSAYAERLTGIEAPVDGKLARPRDQRLVANALTDLQSQVDGVRSAFLTDRDGVLVSVAPAGRSAVGLDLSDRDWARALKMGRSPYISRAYRAATEGNPKVTAAGVLIRNRSGAPLGMLIASDSDRTQTFTDAYGRQVGARVQITDQSGVLVGRTGQDTDALVSRVRDPLVGAALRGQSGVAVRTVDGRRVVTGYAPVSTTGWTVLAEVPAEQAFADVRGLRATLLAGAAVVAALLAGLIPLLITRLSNAQEALGVSEAFQRDLLPSVLPAGVRSHYVASERRMLLGGDFLDAVITPDGGLAVCIGDVSGHGPHAAALGATLRAGWRTLALAGLPVERMSLLDRLVEGERPNGDLFATMACATVPANSSILRYTLAGHPPPVLVDDGVAEALDGARGPALGIGTGAGWPVGEHPLGPDWTLALYTDGLSEARRDEHSERLGVDGLLRIVAELTRGGRLDGEALIARVAAMSDERPDGLDDDLALLLIDGRVSTAAARVR